MAKVKRKKTDVAGFKKFMKQRYVRAARKEIFVELDKFLDRLYKKYLWAEAHFMNIELGGKKRKFSLLWDPYILRNAPWEECHTLVQLSPGVYWSPASGLSVHEEYCHEAIWVMMKKYYSLTATFIPKKKGKS